MSATTSPILPNFNNWLSKKAHFRSKTIQIGERPKTRSSILDLKVDTSIAQDLSRLSIPQQSKTSHPLVSPILNDGPLSRSISSSSDCSDTTPYLAPCERKVCSTEDDYLINEKLPKLDTLMSKVEFGIRRSDFTPLAFKTIRDDKIAKKELRNLKMVKDLPHVIQILDYFYDDNGHTVLVLPVLKKFEFHKMDFLQLAKYSQQLIKAIDGVHSRGLIHMDVTCSNLMLDSEGKLVLIDLGLARKHNRPCTSPFCPSEEPECSCGTPGFISPEVYHNETPTYKSDIYSVGIVLGCMLEHYLVGCDLHYLGGSLVRSSTTEVIIQKLISFLSHRPTSGSCGSSIASSCYYTNDTPDVMYDAADLLQSMIQTDPENRPSSSEILLHPFYLTLDKLSSSSIPLLPTLDPFANTDWETYENKKRILTYRGMQWQQSMDSDEDCYYSYL